MAKMNCKCGCILSTTQAPNDIQLKVYTDKEWEKILDCDIVESWKIPEAVKNPVSMENNLA